MTRHIGIDLHTDRFTACILQEGEAEQLQTLRLQNGDLERFLATLRPDDELAVEASGNTAWFRERVSAHVARVIVVAPGQFEVVRLSIKKTDKNDARAIALFLSKGMLPEASLEEGVHAELASLVATRDHMVKTRTSALNKVRGLLNRHGIKVGQKALGSGKGFAKALGLHEWSRLERMELEAIAAHVAFLNEQEKKLKVEIAAAAKTLPGYENLISIKGIGEIGAAVLLSNIVDIGNFKKSGHLAAFLGMTPSVSQSNDSLRFGRITKRGSKIARTTLVQCALVAKRYSPYLHDFHEKIKSKRGAGKANIAVARKLLNTIFYTLKNNWVFEDFPNFALKTCNQS